MIIHIQVDESLSSMEGRITRSTFEQLKKYRNLVEYNNSFAFGDLERPTALVIISEEENHFNGILYVDPELKNAYYPDKNEITIE